MNLRSLYEGVSTLYIQTVAFLFSTFGRYIIGILCLGFVAASGLSFLYVRSQIRRLIAKHGGTGSIEERRPVLTLLRERLELCEEEESDSSSDCSDEE
jgi:hypothetical protein